MHKWKIALALSTPAELILIQYCLLQEHSTDDPYSTCICGIDSWCRVTDR